MRTRLLSSFAWSEGWTVYLRPRGTKATAPDIMLCYSKQTTEPHNLLLLFDIDDFGSVGCVGNLRAYFLKNFLQT